MISPAPAQSLKKSTRELVQSVGRYVLLLWDALGTPSAFLRYGHEISAQMMRVGVRSLPIVMLAAAFTGGVTTLQTIYQMDAPLVPMSTVGAVVVPTLILESGALITAFILAGRVGARIAAELGSMRVGDQIDALEVMGLNSTAYLVAPRVLAGTLLFPILYVAACLIGSLASVLVVQFSDQLTVEEFFVGARSFFTPFYAFYGLIKAAVFGFLLSSISCYVGYYTEGGAVGVGRSATQAAVVSCVYILLADYILAATLL